MTTRPGEKEIEKFLQDEKGLEFEKPVKNGFLSFFVAAIILGFLAGIIGSAIGIIYLPNLLLWREMNLGRYNLPDQSIVIQGPKNVVVEQNQLLAEVVKNSGAILAEIYPKKNASASALEEIYLPGDRLGNGFVLTSDGWIMGGGKNLMQRKKENIIISIGDKMYSVKELVSDQALGAVFLKVEANNLPVAKLGSYKNLVLGEDVAVLSRNGLGKSSVRSLDYAPVAKFEDLIHSTDTFFSSILIDVAPEKSLAGSPLFNLRGEIVGFLSESDKGLNILPIDYFTATIDGVLKIQKIKRPILGINYLDLGEIAGAEKIKQGQSRGALVYGQGRIPAVLKNSPADKAGLRLGDIILKVNDDEVDGRNNLTELIQSYKPGETLDLLVRREGKESVVKVALE